MAAVRFGAVNISAINEDFYVRTKLNLEHVQSLETLYAGGAHLPAIKVTRDLRVVDGRHRLHALRNLEKSSVDVEYVDETDRNQLMTMALVANVGGSLPPTHADIVFAIGQLLDNGMQRSVITRELSGKWPNAVVRSYLDDAAANLHKARVVKAIHLVVDGGKTMAEAAETVGIKVDQLRQAMAGRKKGRATLGDVKAGLSKLFRSTAQTVRKFLERVQDAYEDGRMSAEEVAAVLGHIHKHGRATERIIRDWERRIGVRRLNGATETSEVTSGE